MDGETKLCKSTCISVNIDNFSLLERLNVLAEEYDKDWNTLINLALRKFLDDVAEVRNLRL